MKIKRFGTGLLLGDRAEPAGLMGDDNSRTGGDAAFGFFELLDIAQNLGDGWVIIPLRALLQGLKLYLLEPAMPQNFLQEETVKGGLDLLVQIIVGGRNRDIVHLIPVGAYLRILGVPAGRHGGNAWVGMVH